MFIFFAGSLLFNEQFGDVSNLFAEILKKKQGTTSLLLTVVIYLGHFKNISGFLNAPFF